MKFFMHLKRLSYIELFLMILGLSGCSKICDAESPQAARTFKIMAINDIYNIEGVDGQKTGGLARLRTLRDKLSTKDNPILLLHAGDFLYPSLMSRLYDGEQMIDMMNRLDGEKGKFDQRFFVVFGNHEFDKKAAKDADVLGKRIEESEFYWLKSNITLAQEIAEDHPKINKILKQNAITTINGIRVGLFGLTTNVAIPEYAIINPDYIAVAKNQVRDLRKRGAEVVIAVTHLSISDDEELLKALGENGPDVIFGGHEHNRQDRSVGNRRIIKADAEGRSATIATISVAPKGKVSVNFRYETIDDAHALPDAKIKARSDEWLARHAIEYCKKKDLPTGCLHEPINKTNVELIAEEAAIRRYETNLGAFVADQMISAFDGNTGGVKVQISMINSGSLRLNQNIPAGTDLTRWHIDGLFQYSTPIRIIRITGAQLKQVLNHSIKDWEGGNGWWLQTSGIAFRHDIAKRAITDLVLYDRNKKKSPINDSDDIIAAVGDFIVNPIQNGKPSNQDGYTMLNLGQEIKYSGDLIKLENVVSGTITAHPISPLLPGRVCSSDKPPPTTPCVL